jgi:hypothetical protein
MSKHMSILKMLGQHSFDIATTMTLASAFDSAWLTLQKGGGEIVTDKQAGGTRDLLARRLVAIAAGGERNFQALVDGALAQFAGAEQDSASIAAS